MTFASSSSGSCWERAVNASRSAKPTVSPTSPSPISSRAIRLAAATTRWRRQTESRMRESIGTIDVERATSSAWSRGPLWCCSSSTPASLLARAASTWAVAIRAREEPMTLAICRASCSSSSPVRTRFTTSARISRSTCVNIRSPATGVGNPRARHTLAIVSVSTPALLATSSTSYAGGAGSIASSRSRMCRRRSTSFMFHSRGGRAMLPRCASRFANRRTAEGR
ncbi:MAG: hypothetical protein KatS3mg008_1947 [Acidimicrobiales bacterium]|nr:MAG: hypothetical protein KatS3mg008_1947 [Acidimicrobiales bacterium]